MSADTSKVKINNNSSWTHICRDVSEVCASEQGVNISNLHTHPIQAAQVFDLVLVCIGLVVDDGVLFVHAARLNHTQSSQSL